MKIRDWWFLACGINLAAVIIGLVLGSPLPILNVITAMFCLIIGLSEEA